MLWTIGILSLIGWIVGIATVGDQVGPAIHVLLLFAITAFGYAVVRRHRASGVVKRTSHSPEARSRA